MSQCNVRGKTDCRAVANVLYARSRIKRFRTKCSGPKPFFSFHVNAATCSIAVRVHVSIYFEVVVVVVVSQNVLTLTCATLFLQLLLK